jgi:phospholipid/cholesterol/gamma-HCH transport system ATP-binding protein
VGHAADPDVHIEVRDVTLAFGSFVVQRDLDFRVKRGEVFIVMGGSGCGKSTVLKAMIGLKRPDQGDVFYSGEGFWAASDERREALMHNFGVLFQQGALWSSMTLEENVALPLAQYTDLAPDEIADVCALKLALVGLAGFDDYYPNEISGGMRKRAALARAMALDPEVLYFDEPGAGLDPISSKLQDDLVLELRDSLGATVVIVTHELESIFSIADNCVFLDPETKTQLATGKPLELREHSEIFAVRNFLNRGTLQADAAG